MQINGERFRGLYSLLSDAIERGDIFDTVQLFLDMSSVVEHGVQLAAAADYGGGRKRHSDEVRKLKQTLGSLAGPITRNQKLAETSTFLIGEKISIDQPRYARAGGKGIVFARQPAIILDARPAMMRSRYSRETNPLDYLIRREDHEEQWVAEIFKVARSWQLAADRSQVPHVAKLSTLDSREFHLEYPRALGISGAWFTADGFIAAQRHARIEALRRHFAGPWLRLADSLGRAEGEEG